MRTAFGRSAGREDGALGWLSVDDGHHGIRRRGVGGGNLKGTGGVQYRTSWDAGVDGSESVGDGDPGNLRSSARILMTDGSATRPLVWLRDGTARALVVVTTRADAKDRPEEEIDQSGRRGTSAYGGPDNGVPLPSSWVGSATVRDVVATNATNGNTCETATVDEAEEVVVTDEQNPQTGGKGTESSTSETPSKRRRRPWERPHESQAIHGQNHLPERGVLMGKFPRPAAPCIKSGAEEGIETRTGGAAKGGEAEGWGSGVEKILLKVWCDVAMPFVGLALMNSDFSGVSSRFWLSRSVMMKERAPHVAR